MEEGHLVKRNGGKKPVSMLQIFGGKMGFKITF